jgi:hypothetical protein
VRLIWLALLLPPQPLLVSVARVESRHVWTARAGSHRGPYQVSSRFSRLPWWALHLEPVARFEAWRHLTYWHRQSGSWCGALRGYRYGWAGVRGDKGQRYAAAVSSECVGL